MSLKRRFCREAGVSPVTPRSRRVGRPQQRCDLGPVAVNVRPLARLCRGPATAPAPVPGKRSHGFCALTGVLTGNFLSFPYPAQWEVPEGESSSEHGGRRQVPGQFLPRPPQPLVRGSGLAHGRAGHAAVNSLSRAVSGGVAVAAASSLASHRDRHLGRHCFQTHGQECSRCDSSVQIPRFRSHFLSLSLSLCPVF